MENDEIKYHSENPSPKAEKYLLMVRTDRDKAIAYLKTIVTAKFAFVETNGLLCMEYSLYDYKRTVIECDSYKGSSDEVGNYTWGILDRFREPSFKLIIFFNHGEDMIFRFAPIFRVIDNLGQREIPSGISESCPWGA